MNRLITSFAVCASLLLPSIAAIAGEHGDHHRSEWRGRSEYRNYNQNRDYNRNYRRNDNYSNYGRNSQNWNSGYGNYDSYNTDYSYYGGRNHRRGNGDTVVLGIGLGILGLALAASANSKKNRQVRDRDWNNPDGSYPADPPVGYREPDYDANLPAANDLVDISCLQTREYQANIRIDGKTVRAYGTACLQPDGSWRKGPPTAEPSGY
jgi:hypothetical protein